jgi:hypothetical protein
MRRVGQPAQTERVTGIGIGRTYVNRGYRPVGRVLDAASDEGRRVLAVRVCRRAVTGIVAALAAGHPARAQGWPTRLVVPDGDAQTASSR